MNYCRPVTYELSLYVDTNTDKTFEAGTPQFPYSNLAFAFLEAFNFRSSLLYEEKAIKIYLQEGEHTVYSGLLPLLAMTAEITVVPWVPGGERPRIRFERNVDEGFNTYLQGLYGRSLAQVNYVYRELPSRSYGFLFHAYLPKSYVTIFSTQLSFQDIYLK